MQVEECLEKNIEAKLSARFLQFSDLKILTAWPLYEGSTNTLFFVLTKTDL